MHSLNAEEFEKLVVDELDLLPDEMVDGLENVEEVGLGFLGECGLIGAERRSEIERQLLRHDVGAAG